MFPKFYSIFAGIGRLAELFGLYKFPYTLAISFISTNKPKPIGYYFAIPLKFVTNGIMSIVLIAFMNECENRDFVELCGKLTHFVNSMERVLKQ